MEGKTRRFFNFGVPKVDPPLSTEHEVLRRSLKNGLAYELSLLEICVSIKLGTFKQNIFMKRRPTEAHSMFELSLTKIDLFAEVSPYK